MRKKRLLVIEDDPLILDMLNYYFREKGYEVFLYHEPLACSTLEGRHVGCRSKMPCSDIVLTDFHMPTMTGLEMILSQEACGCKVNIGNKAVMSGAIDRGPLEIIRQKGITFFQKPFEPSELDHWLSACNDRIDLSKPLSHKRPVRHKVHIKVSFHTGVEDTPSSGIVTEINLSGLGLKTSRKLTKGQRVTFTTTLPNSCNEAHVRWVIKDDDSSYKVGLKCCYYMGHKGKDPDQ